MLHYRGTEIAARDFGAVTTVISRLSLYCAPFPEFLALLAFPVVRAAPLPRTASRAPAAPPLITGF